MVDVRAETPWLDIVSYGRRGPGQRRLGPAQYAAIARTAGGVPEVMVKVTGGGRSLQQVMDELDYFGRDGELEFHTDEGTTLQGKNIGKDIVADWDLELEALRDRRLYSGKSGRRSPKMAHNILLSMPPGTPPEKVLAASKKFAFEKFALQNRYAMALHTDRPHPHVHLIVKAIGEDGVRLHIDKDMLREWRQSFARYLRELGVAANATDRKTRGVTKPQKLDGIYRANLRKASHHMIGRAEVVGSELLKGNLRVEPIKTKMLKTREDVKRGWAAIRDQLKEEGKSSLAEQVERFVQTMPPVRTEKEWIAADIMQRVREEHVRNQHVAPKGRA